MEGHIHVESSAAQGTTCIIDMPATHGVTVSQYSSAAFDSDGTLRDLSTKPGASSSLRQTSDAATFLAD
ncbi:MAG: hypothetical protein ACI8T1_000719 [Verrucomicrobiales bacterium]|jgi:hypothetical protein